MELIVTPGAMKQLKAQPQADAKRLVAAKREITTLHPQRMAYVTGMVGQPGIWRARQGNFRALFEITETAVIVIAVGNRRDIYE